MSSKLEKILDSLSELSVLEISELSKLLEEKWGVSAAPVAVAAVASGSADAGKAEEKTEFAVSLVSLAADKKVSVIKIVREISGLGLVEAKNFVDAVAGGEKKELKSGLSKADAEAMKAKFEAEGAKVELK